VVDDVAARTIGIDGCDVRVPVGNQQTIIFDPAHIHVLQSIDRFAITGGVRSGRGYVQPNIGLALNGHQVLRVFGDSQRLGTVGIEIVGDAVELAVAHINHANLAVPAGGDVPEDDKDVARIGRPGRALELRGAGVQGLLFAFLHVQRHEAS
jgi:hypothetical protein